VDTEIVLGRRNDIPAAMVPWRVIGFFDAVYIDDTQDKHSTMAYIFFYHGCAISWMSKKQQTVTLSTTEAEYLAGTEATKEAMWIAAFLEEIGQKTEGPIQLRGDNQGANALAANPEYHGRTKHIYGRQRFITEMVEQKVIEVAYIPTKDMIADTLTKPLPREQYERFMTMMGLRKIHASKDFQHPIMPLQHASVAVERFQCLRCLQIFPSNNKVHKHLRSERHEF